MGAWGHASFLLLGENTTISDDYTPRSDERPNEPFLPCPHAPTLVFNYGV